MLVFLGNGAFVNAHTILLASRNLGRINIEYNDRFYTRGRIIRLDELSFVIRLERRTTEDSWSRRIMRLVPVFILETNNQTINECLPKFVQTDNASSSIKVANLTSLFSQLTFVPSHQV